MLTTRPRPQALEEWTTNSERVFATGQFQTKRSFLSFLHGCAGLTKHDGGSCHRNICHGILLNIFHEKTDLTNSFGRKLIGKKEQENVA